MNTANGFFRSFEFSIFTLEIDGDGAVYVYSGGVVFCTKPAARLVSAKVDSNLPFDRGLGFGKRLVAPPTNCL